MPAIAAASRVPIRRFSSSGPEKAFCTGHLLVEDEADEERERLLGEERVGLVVAGEVEAVGCWVAIVPILAPDAFSQTSSF